MKPIAQTFIVNEPPSGAEGVFITKVDLFFRDKHPVFGVELQIRTTENGFPSQKRLPFARKVLESSQVNTSSTGSIATTFTLDTPVFVRTGENYALCVIPVGGNDGYNIWTAEIGGTDVVTQAPIYKNHESGILFTSSNDTAFTPIQTEDLKYTLYTAEFTSSTGTAVFRNPTEDFIEVGDIIGEFQAGERVYVSNGDNNTARLSVSSISGTFSNGEVVFQSNGTANVATGTVYSTNSSIILVANTTGNFNTSNTLFGVTSLANCTVSSVNANVVVNSTTTITVPDSSIYAAGNWIYVSKNNGTNTQVVTVTATPTSTTITVNTAITFTDTNSIIGRVMRNGDLDAAISNVRVHPDMTRILLDDVGIDDTKTLREAIGFKIIGITTGTTAVVKDVYNPPYNSLIPQFAAVSPKSTSLNFSFRGSTNSASYDSSFIPIKNDIANELYDKERAVMSRSNEFAYYGGTSSLQVAIDMNSSSTKVSPSIDMIRKNMTFTYNIVAAEEELTGYYLNISNTAGNVSIGDTLTFGSNTGTVHYANSSFVRVINTSGSFGSGNTANGPSGNVYVNSSEYYSEDKDNGYFRASRYISKSVILAEGQDSEDIRVYLAAYRPAGTNIKVYGKFLNSQDGRNFEDVNWTELTELSSPALLSSTVNKEDFVELEYGLPKSVEIYTSNTSCNTGNNNVTVYTTDYFRAGDFIYIEDAATNQFNVRQVANVVNTTVLTVTVTPSINVTSAAVGTIPGLKVQTGAFCHANNSGIVRYSSNTDAIYETYKTFAIKILPVTENSYTVPRVGDMRAIALQI